MAAVLPNKRKRDTEDLGAQRPAPVMSDNAFDPHVVYDMPTDHNMDFVAQHNAGFGAAPDAQQDPEHKFVQLDSTNNAGQSASDTAAAAMAQYHTMTVPQSTEQAFMSHPGDGTDRPGSSSLDPGNTSGEQRTSFSDFDISTLKGDAPETAEGEGSPTMGGVGVGGQKPQVGSDEWHKVRRDNHKEVERRRRETINEGITELAKIVPGCEKNKGSILARAVQFIVQLKENETQNIEKWTLEKMLTEQAIAELSSSCDKLKNECQRAWAECEQWKKAAQKAGVTIDGDNKLPGGDQTE